MELSLVEVRQNLSSYIKKLNKPITILVHKKPVAILAPFTEEESLYRTMEAGDVSYDEYRKRLLEIGFEQLQARRVSVNPNAVIASENLEETKKGNRIAAAGFLLDAAKFWAGHHERHICSKCGHRMLPESVYNELKTKGEL